MDSGIGIIITINTNVEVASGSVGYHLPEMEAG